MLEPGTYPPPAEVGGLNLLVFRNAPCDGERGVERFESGGQRVNERDVVASGRRYHRQAHAHLRARLDVPCAFRVAPHVLRIVNGLVHALDREAVVGGRELQRRGRVLQTDAVVETARSLLL